MAADRCHGTGRAPLVEMLWRVKMPQAHDVLIEAINDPDGVRRAMSALRRRIGNESTRPLIEPLVNHRTSTSAERPVINSRASTGLWPKLEPRDG